MAIGHFKLTDLRSSSVDEFWVASAAIEYPLCVRDLLTLLDRLERWARSGNSAARPSLHWWESLVRGVLLVLLDRSIGVPAFMACAHVFRTVGLVRDGAIDAGMCDEIRQRIGRAARPLETLHPKVALAVARLETAGKDVLRMREAEVARECGVDSAHIGRLLRRQTGLGFREWRWGIAMRLGVRALTDTDGQIKYIAAESGFVTHTGSTAGFERSFYRLFGMAPGEFRRFVRNVASSA